MSDLIMDRYTELSLQNIIPDMYEYAKEWQVLALQCDIEGRVSTAETCRNRAKHYCEIGKGEYIRLVEDSFAELIPVEAQILESEEE